MQAQAVHAEGHRRGTAVSAAARAAAMGSAVEHANASTALQAPGSCLAVLLLYPLQHLAICCSLGGTRRHCRC